MSKKINGSRSNNTFSGDFYKNGVKSQVPSNLVDSRVGQNQITKAANALAEAVCGPKDAPHDLTLISRLSTQVRKIVFKK